MHQSDGILFHFCLLAEFTAEKIRARERGMTAQNMPDASSEKKKLYRVPGQVFTVMIFRIF